MTFYLILKKKLLFVECRYARKVLRFLISSKSIYAQNNFLEYFLYIYGWEDSTSLMHFGSIKYSKIASDCLHNFLIISEVRIKDIYEIGCILDVCAAFTQKFIQCKW